MFRPHEILPVTDDIEMLKGKLLVIKPQSQMNSTLLFIHLADALIQSDLQEQLGLSALLKGTSADFSPSR
jgi:hypothetical protein